MPLVLADRVKETTTTTGTGTITLDGASTGFRSFSVVGNGNTTYYTIAGQGTSEWEVGIGTYTASGTTLSRDTVLASSAGAPTKTTFSSGTKDVFVTYPAGRSVYVDGSTVDAAGLGSSAGQLLYGSATDTFALLAAGSSGQVLTSGGAGAPSWTSQSSLSVGSATTATTATTANALNSANNYSVTRLTATPNTSGVSTGITCVNGDMTAYRTGGTTGVIYLSSSGSHYLYWDGTNYNLNSGNLICTGNVTAFSDERYKTNWRSVTPEFVEKLAQVRSGIYDRTDEAVTQAGVSAQSLQEVLPETVLEDESGRLSVAYGNAALVACVELAKELVKLRAEVEALKKGS